MATPSRPSLDPRKNPWKRGDVCSLGFEKNGVVLDATADYLEVRWLHGGPVERLTGVDVENLLRLSHANDLSASGEKTNLEVLETSEALGRVDDALQARIAAAKSESEREELDRMTRRAFAPKMCDWDKKHQTMLVALIIYPKSVGLGFRISDRIHRAFCKQHEQ